MNKTTPEEAIWLAGKHGQRELTADRSAYFTAVQLAALIDEVRAEKALEYVSLFGELQNALEKIDEVRGVDAEPYGYVWFNEHMEHRFTRNKPHSSQFCTDLKPIRDRPHPAPSQPAAPVELPVVGDTERLEFMANSPARYIEKYERMWRVYQDQALPTMASANWIAMTTQYWATPREAIDAAIAAAQKGAA